MRIAFVGNRKNLDNDGKSFNTETHIAATLEMLGCEVKFIQENEIQPGQLADLVKGCNLFFWIRTWEGFVTLEDLKAIRALGIPSVNYHLDAFIGLDREKSLDTDPRWRCDYVFTADGDPRSEEIFKAKGINHHFLWPGVFEPEAYLLDLPRKQHEFIFVGSWRNYHSEWPYREQLVRWLMQTYGDRFEIWGSQGKGLVRGAELNRLYASTAITIGDTFCKDFKHERYISDRVMEGLGRGAFMIHPYVKGIEECFELGKELITYEYGNFEQLADLIQYYFTHDEEREVIRRAGHERVKKDHTYTNRMRQLLDIVFPNEVKSEGEKELEERLTLAEAKSKPTHLNLGAGEDIKTGDEWLNLDHLPLPGVRVVHNLVFLPYPFEDEQFEYVQAIDLVEHLPNYTPDWKPMIVAFIEEMYRILKPGGTLYMQTPGYNAEFAWQDITHTRAFHPKSFDLFDETTEFGRTTSFYSKARFSVRSEELPNHNLRFYMEKR